MLKHSTLLVGNRLSSPPLAPVYGFNGFQGLAYQLRHQQLQADLLLLLGVMSYLFVCKRQWLFRAGFSSTGAKQRQVDSSAPLHAISSCGG
jgi:hypothetical protein